MNIPAECLPCNQMKTNQFQFNIKKLPYSTLCIALSPDGKTIASGSLDKTVKLWDVATGKNTVTLDHTADVWSVAYSPDGNTLASGSWDNTVRLWDATTGQERASLQGHTSHISSVVFSPDGKALISVDYLGNVLTHAIP